MLKNFTISQITSPFPVHIVCVLCANCFRQFDDTDSISLYFSITNSRPFLGEEEQTVAII